MPVSVDPRALVQQALAKFGSAPLPEAARGLFTALGYQSKRTLRITSVKQFCEYWDADGVLTAKERASLNQLTGLHFLFQLTDAELSSQTDLFTNPGTVDGTRIHSYLFLAAELPAGNYSRTDLTAIARALNKPLSMPALVLFKHGLPAEGQAKAGDSLSLAVLHRRLNKTSADRDVLEKATLIKDIRCAAPHRAHVEILADLAFESLKASHSITNFVQLHATWRDTLDIQELNKRFYRELQHWYFWALGHVRFPDGAPKDAEDRDSLSLIRLLTRLIFVWFLKEKGLVPENLFDARILPGLLKGFSPASTKAKDSVYYRAVLQNLFFATLNCEQKDRAWAREGQNMMAHSLYRFREDFASASTALDFFKDIPFLNGGLFECLDKDLGEGAKSRYIRIDGFSRRDDSQPVVPDFLFFGPEQETDLSDFYEEKKSGKKARPVRVRGLIEILHDFKFTIEENTPLEEDVALDPELLGRVFENLLAAYNPETQVTARKQTGSFYTPREIVDYMTGQALFYALREKVASLPDLDARLKSLLAHDDAPNPFKPAETARLIAALDELKILDPACGSGAFPMGILHRMVQVLQKLDPGNALWKKRQLDKVAELTDSDVRDLVRKDIEEAFAANELGYGRKLYLIENCLYGVDIQPIAAQITKLRFFISLVVEQKVDPNAPNRGIRPLPNLETKIVAANTLLGIARPGQQMLRNFDIDAKEAELRHIRDDHFLAKTPKKKAKCREEDARLREEIATLLKDDGWDSNTAKKLAAWDPYDQNAHADFFDNEWMFGLTEGFDVVIGNPPYVSNDTIPDGEKEAYQARYLTGKRFDLYQCFLELGVRLLGVGGEAAFILPNTFLTGKSYALLREFLLRDHSISEIVDLPQGVFDSVTVDNVLIFVGSRVRRGLPIRINLMRERAEIERLASANWDQTFEVSVKTYLESEHHTINVGITPAFRALFSKLACGKILGDEFDVCDGLIPYKTAKDAAQSLYTGFKEKRGWKKLLRGKGVARYRIIWQGEFVNYGDHLWSKREERFFLSPKILLHAMRNKSLARRLVAAIDYERHYNTDNLINVIRRSGSLSLEALAALLNSTLVNFWYRTNFPNVNINPNELRAVPLPSLIDDSVLRPLVLRMVKAAAHENEREITEIDKEIDRHVYALYGLTPEEIKLVEGSNREK